MTVLARFLLLSLIVSAGYGHEPFPEPLKNVLIGKLVIESNTLPSVDREHVVRLFEPKTYVPKIQCTCRSKRLRQEKVGSIVFCARISSWPVALSLVGR